MLNVLVPISNFFLRFLFHLAMLPIVAGISYEVLMGLAHSNSKAACILRWPGMQMQRLTTREPDASIWAVFTDYRQSEPGYVPPAEEAASESGCETPAEPGPDSNLAPVDPADLQA